MNWNNPHKLTIGRVWLYEDMFGLKELCATTFYASRLG